ncbi:MAG: dephospho-CoA kinase, partial [Alphaproteobacteria bacterium]
MLVIGLTGSIAMGKSTAARMLTTMGIPVHDADLSVHKLMGEGGSAVDEISKAFPGTLNNQAIDRAKLGSHVFGDSQALKKLESILHPKVHRLT